MKITDFPKAQQDALTIKNILGNAAQNPPVVVAFPVANVNSEYQDIIIQIRLKRPVGTFDPTPMLSDASSISGVEARTAIADAVSQQATALFGRACAAAETAVVDAARECMSQAAEIISIASKP
jgi:hypothetical protein